MWVFRTMIVSDAVVDTCRSLAMLLAGDGQKLWATPLSPTGTEPATHWISSGMIEAQFGELLPLSEWVYHDESGWIENMYQPDTALLAERSGGAVTPEQVFVIFSQCDVTMEEPITAIARLGLQIVTVPEPDPFRPS